MKWNSKYTFRNQKFSTNDWNMFWKLDEKSYVYICVCIYSLRSVALDINLVISMYSYRYICKMHEEDTWLETSKKINQSCHPTHRNRSTYHMIRLIDIRPQLTNHWNTLISTNMAVALFSNWFYFYPSLKQQPQSHISWYTCSHWVVCFIQVSICAFGNVDLFLCVGWHDWLIFLLVFELVCNCWWIHLPKEWIRQEKKQDIISYNEYLYVHEHI